MSETIERLTGYTSDGLSGRPIEVLIPLKYQTDHLESRTKFSHKPNYRQMGNGQSFSILYKDGSERPVAVALSPITVDDSPWVIAAIHDKSPGGRTDAKVLSAEMDLVVTKLNPAILMADSEERFRLAFEDNMAPMILTDLDDRIVTANSAFCLLLGRTKVELIGATSESFTHRDDVGITERAHHQIAAGDSSQVRYVKRYIHKDGRVVVVEVSKSAARDVAGATLYYVISERDVTGQTVRNRLMDLRAAVNRIAVEAVSEGHFLRQLCKLIVDQAGYPLAWIGVGIALDDFGTGYSSLAYLALWLPKVIKIDRSFVSPSQESNHSRVLLETIVSLGLKLNITVLAEGIKTEAQHGLLRQLGCQLGQGYLFSPAVPSHDVQIMMKRIPGIWWGEKFQFQPQLEIREN